MSDAPIPRPGQATFAVLLIGVGSLLAIVASWERIAALQTLAVQDELARLTAEGSFGAMSVDSLSTMFRVLSLVGGGAAAAAAVLSVYAWQRSTSARVALTVLTPFLFIGWLGKESYGFFEPIVLAGIALLWLPPTRDWYAGRDWRAELERRGYGRPPAGRAGSTARPDPFATPPVPPAPPAPTPPPVVRPVAPPPDEHGAGGPPWASAPPPLPHAVWSPAAYPPLHPAPRPNALVWACVVTWICTSTIGGALAMMSLTVLTDDSYLRNLVIDTGWSVQQVRTALLVATAIAVPLCMLAAALAIGAMVGRPAWARLALAAVSSFSGIVCVGLSLLSAPIVLPGLAAFTVAYLLARREVVEWRPPARR